MSHCIADGCERPAEGEDRKYCHGHRKREKDGRPIDGQLRPWRCPPGEYLKLKALEYAEAQDDKAMRLAAKRLKSAARQYARACLKVPRRSDDAS